MNRIIYTLLVVFALHYTTYAQNELVTIQKDSIPFEKAIQAIEQQTGYTIFYAPEWVDSLQVSLHFDNIQLKEILNVIGKSRKLKFTFLKGKKIVYSKNYRIKTNYNTAFLRYLKNKEESIRDTTTYVAPEAIAEKTVINKEYQLFTIGSPSIEPDKKTATLQGTIRDVAKGGPLMGATVYVDKLKLGAATNAHGFYSLTLPKGQYRLTYSLLSMRTTHRNIIIHSDGKMSIEMEDEPTSLSEVIVTARKDDPVKNTNMGMEKISYKALKQLPLGLGEADIIKSTLMLPGVQSVGEAANGFNVRGGSIDQNLVLLNGAPIMNTSHLFGFFSGFNSEVVKDITLYKSGVPAKYGGRVSSVMNLTMKEGNRKKLKISGGISPMSGKLVIEAPIVKDKSSFILGARSTYSNWVLRMLKDEKLKNSKANFHDLQGKFSYDINDNNSIYLSGYISHDDFDYFREDAFAYNTKASTLEWKHIFSPKLFSTFSAVMSNYDYTLQSRTVPDNLHSVAYYLNQYAFKADFSYFTEKNHEWSFGLQSTYYDLSPGKRTPLGEDSNTSPKTIANEQALESALYLSDEFDLSERISISAGVRWPFYTNFGPKEQLQYTPNAARNTNNITDTLSFGANKPIQFYTYPELRFSSKLKLASNTSLKLGVSRMYQYIHMISNTAAMSPTDIWKLSDKYLKPQRSDQVSLGLYQNLRRKTIEATIEGYYKRLDNIIDYKGGAQLVMNEHLETDVLNGQGKAYGVEVMLQKKTGKLTGWINYTYSRVLHQIDSPIDEERVNRGEYFPTNYDKPHDFKFVANYKASRRFNVSCNFVYSTGRPYTPPVAYYKINNAYRVYYSDRNSIRMSDYIRLDFAATINGNLKKNKMNHSSLTFAVYNAIGRKNDYSVFFKTEGERVQGYKMSIYAQPIFTITYNFKFMGNAKDDF